LELFLCQSLQTHHYDAGRLHASFAQRLAGAYSRATRQYHPAAGIIDTIIVQHSHIGDVAGVVRVTYSAPGPVRQYTHSRHKTSTFWFGVRAEVPQLVSRQAVSRLNARVVVIGVQVAGYTRRFDTDTCSFLGTYENATLKLPSSTHYIVDFGKRIDSTVSDLVVTTYAWVRDVNTATTKNRVAVPKLDLCPPYTSKLFKM
jgi:hypothetical protein